MIDFHTQGRRKLFYGRGLGDRGWEKLSENVGHYDWPTATNFKITPSNTP